MAVAREQTQVQPITEAYLAELADEPGKIEVVDGEIITMPPPGRKQGRVGARVIHLLLSFVEEKGLGEVFGETTYVLEGEPGHIRRMRAPDVSFVAKANLPAGQDDGGYFYQPPDLAVEIVSPTERAGDVMRKVNDYLRAGTRLIWIVYPETRQVVVHTPQGATIYGEEQALDGGDLLPGLSVSVAALFG